MSECYYRGVPLLPENISAFKAWILCPLLLTETQAFLFSPALRNVVASVTW